MARVAVRGSQPAPLSIYEPFFVMIRNYSVRHAPLMNPCQNCGKLNTPETNFCRFCGTKFVVQAPMPDNPYDYAAPRPYAWKTDEFQTQNEPRQTAAINSPQPLTQHI